MHSNFIVYLALGMVASFAGTIPVGPINISVVATTIKRNFRAGVIFSSSAAAVEIIQSFIALQFGVILSSLLLDNPYFQMGVTIVLFLIGSIFFFKKQKGIVTEKTKKSLPAWLSGILIGLLNPQALPFWVFVLGYYQSASLIDMNLLSFDQFSCILSFFMGVYLGKFMALSLYSYLSTYLVSRMGQLTFWMNKVLGIVFIFLAITQLIKVI